MLGVFGWGKKWTKVDGTIIDKRETWRSNDGLAYSEEYVVEVRPANRPPFRVKVQEPAIAINFAKPAVGAQVGVEWEEKTGEVRFDKSDPRTDRKVKERAREEADKRRLEEKLRR
jgi:hypothetical protein